MMRTAALLLAAAPVAFARVNSADLNKDQALEALTKIGSLKSMDMEVNPKHTTPPPPPSAVATTVTLAFPMPPPLTGPRIPWITGCHVR